MRARTLVLMLLLGARGALVPGFASAQTSSTHASTPKKAFTFLAGAGSGLVVHELGHATFAAAFDANPRLGKTSGSAFSFFAVKHDAVSRGREFVISSAGFWFQHAISEAVLTAHPRLVEEDRPFMKGVVFFHFGASAVYGIAAFARIGPRERDTLGMATTTGKDGIPEPAIGALVLTPAVLDAYRYFKPGSKWAAWGSRAAKLAGVLLAVRAGR